MMSDIFYFFLSQNIKEYNLQTIIKNLENNICKYFLVIYFKAYIIKFWNFS